VLDGNVVICSPQTYRHLWHISRFLHICHAGMPSGLVSVHTREALGYCRLGRELCPPNPRITRKTFGRATPAAPQRITRLISGARLISGVTLQFCETFGELELALKMFRE
jgi:hypothetical protein